MVRAKPTLYICDRINMLYTLFVFTVGVYVGQEYKKFPAIRSFAEYGITQLSNHANKQPDKQSPFYDIIKTFLNIKKN